MNVKDFEAQLYRSGADMEAWPAVAAREARLLLSQSVEARQALDEMARLESALGSTMPKIAPARAARVTAAALMAIRETPPRLSIVEWIRSLLAAPLPQLAFGLTAAAVGFAIGVAVGIPDGANRTAESQEIPMVTASLSDAAY